MRLSSFKRLVTVDLFNHGSILFTIFFKSFAYIVGKLVMHPCVPFRSDAHLTFLVHLSVHHVHRLKSTGLLHIELNVQHL